jgi:hypothetical protein
MTSSVFHKTNPFLLSLENSNLSFETLSEGHIGTLLDAPRHLSNDSPTDKVLEKFFSAGMLDSNYQLQAEAIQKNLPWLTTEQMQAIERLLSHNLNFNIPIPNQTVIYTISLSMKEFLQVLKQACSEKSIKIENILIIGGAVPWILGSEYCTALLESLVPGSTSSLSRRDLMSIDLPPNDVDIRFIIPPESKEHIQWLKNRVVQYLSNKLPAGDYTQTDLEDMITTMGNVFQEFQQTTLWDQENQKIDIDYFIFGINDLSQSKYEVSLVSLLRRPYLFSMQNLCLDISGFLSENTPVEAICPMSLSVPHSFRDVAQAILEKITRIFHIPVPETVDKKGWICYCSLLTKLIHCPEGSSLAILRAATVAYCLKESQDPQKGSNSPLNILIGFLEWSVRKHHDSKAEDAIALAFNICSTAEGAWSQSDRSILWQTLAAKFPAPAKSLLPPHQFSRAMHNPDFSFDVLSAILEIQAFFYLCSSQAANSNDFTAYLITNDGKPAVQWVDKNRGLLLPFDPLQAFRIVDEKLAELSSQGKLSSVKELEHLWSAFSIPTNPHDERVPPFVRDKVVLKVDYASLDMLAIQLMEHEESFGRRIGYRLFVLLQKLHPESRRRSLLVRHVPDMMALERSREAKVKCLQEVSKEFFGSAPTEISLLLQRALEALIEYICQPNVKDEQILLHWTLGLARIQDHSLYGDVFFFWKRYQFLINGKNDELSEPLIKALLPANILMAGELLLRSVYPIETKLPLYFALFSAHNQPKKCSQSALNVEILSQLTMQLFPCIPEPVVDKDHLAIILHRLVEELLLQKQPVQVHALLLAEEKKRVLAIHQAAKFWASLCHFVLNDPAKGIIPALKIFQEASNYGIWNACKPRRLMLQIIAGLYALGDLCRWHQADGFVLELCDDPETPDEIRSNAIHLLIEKKERISLKESPLYNKIKELFHPSERLEGLRQALHGCISEKKIQDAILILKELSEIHPFPVSFNKDLLSVCSLADQAWAATTTDLNMGRDLLKILCDPLTLKVFSKAEHFPLNFAVRLAHWVQLQGMELLDSMTFDLLLLHRKIPKGGLLKDNHALFVSLICKIVQSTDTDLLKNLSNHADYIVTLLQEGDHFNPLYTFVVNCQKKQILIEESDSFYERLMPWLQNNVDNGDASVILKAQAILKILPLGNPRLSTSIAVLKEKMIDALLRVRLFAEASECVQSLIKGISPTSVSPLIAMHWIPLLVDSKQFDAAGELLNFVSQSSVEARDACTRLWLCFPDEMYLRYPQIGSKLCLQASEKMTEALIPVVVRVLFFSVQSDGNSLLMENALSLLERYAIPPYLWRMVFAKIEGQTTKESKAKHKLLPLLTKIGEPSGLFMSDPESRRSCWLSALRSFSSGSYGAIGDLWKTMRENKPDFFEMFSSSDPARLGEAFSLFLNVWSACLEKPNKDPNLFQWVLPMLDQLTPLLSEPKVLVWRQQILLQLIRGGTYSTVNDVLLQTGNLFELLLESIDCHGLPLDSKIEENEIAHALKKLLSAIQQHVQKLPKEDLYSLPSVKVIQKAVKILSEEASLNIFEHVMTLEGFYINEILIEIIDFLLQKFEQIGHEPKLFPTPSKKSDQQVSHIIKNFLEILVIKLDLCDKYKQELPVDLLLKYSKFCEHPAFLYFMKPEMQQNAFKKISKIMNIQILNLSAADRKVITQYIFHGYPYHKIEESSKINFSIQAVMFFASIFILNDTKNTTTNDTKQFNEIFEKFIENYIVCSNLSITDVNQNKEYIQKEKRGNEVYPVLFMIFQALKSVQNWTGLCCGIEQRRCLDEIIGYICNKTIEIIYESSKLNTSAYCREVVVIAWVIKNFYLLPDNYQNRCFKALREVFYRCEKNGFYKNQGELCLFHGVLLQCSFNDELFIDKNKKILFLDALNKVQDWTINSQLPLCVYRMIRILSRYQNDVYANNPQGLISAYQKAKEEVIKNPFYKVLVGNQDIPDHDLEVQPHLNESSDTPAINYEPYLCDVLLEAFLGLDIQLIYCQGKRMQNAYSKIWSSLFQMLLEILNITWNDSLIEKCVPLVIQLLHNMVRKASHVKHINNLQQSNPSRTNLCILDEMFQILPRLNESSTSAEFLELLPLLSSIVEASIQPWLIMDEGSNETAAIPKKAQSFVCTIKESPLLTFVPLEVVLDFFLKAIIPSYIFNLMRIIKTNTRCTEEEKLDICRQYEQQIETNPSDKKKLWTQVILNGL